MEFQMSRKFFFGWVESGGFQSAGKAVSGFAATVMGRIEPFCLK